MVATNMPQDRELLRTRLSLALILVMSVAIRVVLAARGGQFFWTDEGRYGVSRGAVTDILEGHFRAGLNQLFSSADHLFFKVIGVVPSLVENRIGEQPLVPAIFFGSFSVGVIYLVWRLVRARGGSPIEGLFAAFLVAACNSFFYYSRHVFPYDLALCFFIGAALCGFTPGRTNSFLAGVLAGIGFITYNGYWWFGGVMLCLALFTRRESFADLSSRAALIILGLGAPILTVLGIGAILGHNLIASYVWFSRTVTGDMGLAWRFIPEFFWISDRYLFVFLVLALLVALVAWATGRLENRVKYWLVGGLLFYAGTVALCDGFRHFTVFARHARPLAIFLCLIGGWLLSKLWETGRRGRIATGFVLTAILAQAVWNMSVPFRQVFPDDFRKRAEVVIAEDLGRDPGIYRVIEGGFNEATSTPNYPFRVLYRTPHPVEFRPYAYEGYSCAVRAAFAPRDISMRVVRLLPEKPAGRPQISREPGLWGPYPGAMRLEVAFDVTRSTLPQPIVSSGRQGAGDQVFVEFLGPNTLRFGFDHWAVGATYSRPIVCDFAQPHVIVISFGGLYPDETSARFRENPKWQALRHNVLVKFDGEPVIAREMDCYPTQPQSIALFHNLIGFSTAVRDFTGRLFSASPVTSDDVLSAMGDLERRKQ